MHNNCYENLFQKSTAAEGGQGKRSVQLMVWGMGCPNCAVRIQNSLLALQGILDAKIDHTTGIAVVDYNPGLVSVNLLRRTIAHAGDETGHHYVALLI